MSSAPDQHERTAGPRDPDGDGVDPSPDPAPTVADATGAFVVTEESTTLIPGPTECGTAAATVASLLETAPAPVDRPSPTPGAPGPAPDLTAAHVPAGASRTADLFGAVPDASLETVATDVTELDPRAEPGSTDLFVPGASTTTPTQRIAAETSPTVAVDAGERTVPEPTEVCLPGTVGLPGVDLPMDVNVNNLAETEQGAPTGAFEPVVPGMAAAPGPAGPKRQVPDESRCGPYILKHFHARGGMGEVWVADDPNIGRSVALKRMLGRRPDQMHRFRVEAQVTGQLEHPGIVPVYELGVNELGQTFYAMKFVHGRTLLQAIEAYHSGAPRGGSTGDREVEQSRLLQVFLSLCQTVAYAHSRGVLHRDLKPENVMLGSFGETIVLDWGIAKIIGRPGDAPEADADAYVQIRQDAREDTETRAGTIMGTPSYMAPEVAAGLTGEIDQRSDVYLLGATLYEILTGRRPRKGGTALEMIRQAQQGPPVPAVKVKPEVPRALDAICRKAMAHRKEDRYQSAVELAADVERFMAGEPITAYREGFAARAWRWARRRRKALARSAAAALILAVAMLGFARLREAERRRVEAQREAGRLRVEDQARRDLLAFQRLADEARFYAATTDPVGEHAPYFDPRKGEATARAALAIAAKWGPTLAQMPLPEEREPLRRELYDLLVQAAHLRSQQGQGPAAARETLGLLDQAGRLHDPSRSDYRLRAQAYRQLGDATKAAEAERRAEDPGAATTALDHFLLGQKYRAEAAGRTEVETRRQGWRTDPQRGETAINHYRGALAIQPDHYWSHLQIGRTYLSLGRPAEAVEALGACVALRPEASWGYAVRGLALAQQKRYAEAERDLDRAARLSPDSRPARLNRGVVYWLQQKDDEALADFEAVLQPPADKQLIEAAYYRGQLYLQRGEVAKALEDFDRVVAANSDFRPVYPLRARVRIAQGNTAGGLEDLDAYLADGRQGDRPDWESHARRGRLLRLMHAELPMDQRGQPSAQALASLALAELGKAVSLGGRAAQIYDDLGAMLEMTGQRDAAIAAYSRGVELAPNDAKLRIKRAWAYELASEHDKALADLAAAARSDPENAEAHSGLGYIRALRKLPAEAQREAELALIYGADDYLNLHNVACIYAALSQTSGDQSQAPAYQDVAIALLRRAVALWKRAGTGPDEIALMKGEPAFQPLRDRADFRQLIAGGQ